MEPRAPGGSERHCPLYLEPVTTASVGPQGIHEPQEATEGLWAPAAPGGPGGAWAPAGHRYPKLAPQSRGPEGPLGPHRITRIAPKGSTLSHTSTFSATLKETSTT